MIKLVSKILKLNFNKKKFEFEKIFDDTFIKALVLSHMKNSPGDFREIERKLIETIYEKIESI